jgi:hypothetical protein
MNFAVTNLKLCRVCHTAIIFKLCRSLSGVEASDLLGTLPVNSTALCHTAHPEKL